MLAALGVSLGVLLPTSGAAFASVACPGDERLPTVDTTSDAAAALVCDINVLRNRQGLPPLRSDPQLAASAHDLATDMAAHHFVSHVSSDGRGLMARVASTGYVEHAAAPWIVENVDWGSYWYSSPLATAFGWMGSEEHRAHVLDPDVEEVGIGIAEGRATATGPSGFFYVADFGTRGGKPTTATATTQAPRARAPRTLRRSGYTHSTVGHGRRVQRNRRG